MRAHQTPSRSQLARSQSSRSQPTHDPLDAPLARAVEACHTCAEACLACADAGLDDPAVERLGRCIRLTLDCAEACSTTGPALARRTAANAVLLHRMAETCAELCRTCAAECDRHAEEHEHCRLCAEACRTCETACQEAAMSLGATGP